MALMLFSVVDSKVGSFAAPFTCRARGEAVRQFQMACEDDNLPFKRFPADFSLYLVGAFDDTSGLVSGVQPERIMGADEF